MSIHVCKGGNGSLLSFQTAIELGLLDINVNKIAAVSADIKQLASQYLKSFHGVGELKDFKLELQIDTSVPPVAQLPRRIRFHLRKQVSQEVNRLHKDGIIEDIKGPTPCISPLVVVPKPNGNVRLCADMRRANEAILRESDR